METLGRVRNQRKWPFWAVVILSLPTFAAFIIVVSGLVHPNTWVYLVIPLAFFAPASLVVAIGITVATAHFMRWPSRANWVVLAFALAAGMAAIGLLWLAGATELRSQP